MYVPIYYNRLYEVGKDLDVPNTNEGCNCLVELSLLRQSQLNLAHQIMFHLLVVKKPITTEELLLISQTEALEEPEYVEWADRSGETYDAAAGYTSTHNEADHCKAAGDEKFQLYV